MAFKLENKIKHKTIDKHESFSFLKRDIHWFLPIFSNKVKEDFFTELGVLLSAGISLRDSLNLIENSQKKEQLKLHIKKLNLQITEGQPLSIAIKNQKHFTDYEYYSIKIGEETGTLNKVCQQLGLFFAQKNKQRANLISALTYPLIILSTATIVVVFMLRYVVPMFQDLFRQHGVELPKITKLIIAFSSFINNYGFALILVITSLLVAHYFFSKTKKYNKAKDQLILKFPLLGDFVKIIYLSQFTQAIGLLVSSKIPMMNAIKLVKHMIPFYPLQKALQAVEEELLKGRSLSQGMALHAIFDDKMIALIKVAEETNQTEYIFERLHDQYSIQVQHQSKMLSTLMEPIIILVVGGLVGVILIAMYLPMFRLSSVIG